MPSIPPNTSDSEQELESALCDLANKSDVQLRQQLVSRATQAGVPMRAGGPAPYRRPGWYSARESAELAAVGYPVNPLELEFPVSAASPSWHAAEVNRGQGLVFRFFLREAWLSLQAPAGATGLRVRVLYGINREAILETSVRVEGAAVALCRDRQSGATREINMTFADGLTRPLIVWFTCTHEGIPSRLHADSTDSRLLSAAIAKPEWLFQN